MKTKKIIALGFLAIAVGSSLTAGELITWESKPMDKDRCQRDGKTMERCAKENAEDNAYNFTALLSPDVYKIYEDFTPEQKQQAMDYADGNKMSPNDAVREVANQ